MSGLQINQIGADDFVPLAVLFTRIHRDPEARWFHPHDFTDQAARTTTTYAGLDLYVLMMCENDPAGYGLLRGWDEGFDVPSLGIYVAREHRGTGAARLLMEYLHTAARLRGSPAIKLKVYPENERAITLYRKLGYRFSDEIENNQLVGYLQLNAGQSFAACANLEL